MGGYIKSTRVRTLNTASDLKDVSYGHRYPRHGLRLLHWLATDWIRFDSAGTMWATCNPENRDFGFHPFHNQERILPPLNNQSCYYEVGNLHSPGAHSLPFREAPTGGDESNTDRIIVRVDPGLVVGEVYITEHTPHLNSFRGGSTYRISKNLIRSAGVRSVQEFTMGGYSKSTRVRTLNTASDLKDVSYGHRYPRHGLRLLHWLATDWIRFDSAGAMWATRNPENRDFGFHPFHNQEQILPPLNNQSRYYEVGNLHSPGAHSLPFREAPTGGDESNMDRIIVRVDPGLVVGEVYITEHTPHLNSFRGGSTYRISKNLIRSAGVRSVQEFLQLAGYIGEGPQRANENRNTVIYMNPTNGRSSSGQNSTCCNLAMAVIFLIFLYIIYANNKNF
ncbi:hypothetical protein Z043-115235 [Arapaima gigas]